MLGMADPLIALAYWGCLAVALVSVLYGWAKWNKD